MAPTTFVANDDCPHDICASCGDGCSCSYPAEPGTSVYRDGTNCGSRIDFDSLCFYFVGTNDFTGAWSEAPFNTAHMVCPGTDETDPYVGKSASSINAVFALPNQVPYSISKGGVMQLTKVMALALAPYGIRVNAIGPGSIMTDMLSAVNADPAAKNRILSRTPMGRIGEPSEIASVAAFLASDDASYITGQTIYADGGRLPLNYTVPVKSS